MLFGILVEMSSTEIHVISMEKKLNLRGTNYTDVGRYLGCRLY
jgi:hypothetical protein